MTMYAPPYACRMVTVTRGISATANARSNSAPRRSTLVSAGPISSMAAKSIPDFSELAGIWNTMAPLHWDTADAGPTADAIVFLLSTMSRGITGEIMHVDGGFHAMGAPPSPPAEPDADTGSDA